MANKTILFADDSATMRTIMEKAFSAEPFDVTVVPSGEAAILKAQEMRPDIVIADAGMAGVSGYDVCKAVRRDASLSSTPVIIVAGVSNPYDEAKGAEVSATEYLKKPFDTTQLIEKVGQLIATTPAAEVSPPPPPKPPEDRKPAAIPAKLRPIVTPMVAEPPQKDTLEFGRASLDITSVRRGAPTPEESPARVKAPAAESIRQQRVAQPESFKVGTLAELAQKDDKRAPIAPATRGDAIELTKPVKPRAEPGAPASRGAAAPLSIEKAVKDQSRAAAKGVSDKIEGLTPEQAETIRALTTEVIEKVVWEVVPELAETIIKEELARLLEE